jgi:hypothetical protein
VEVIGVRSESVDSDAECWEYCGLPITEEGQRCSAIDDGPCKTTEQVLAEPEGSV